MQPIRFTKEQCLAVLIDLAEGPLRVVGSIETQKLRANVLSLRRAMTLLDVPCLFAQAPFPEPLGNWIPEAGVDPAGVARHSTNDCFETPAFQEAIVKRGRSQLLLCGIATDVGVMLTALSGLRHGYEVAVLVDVCGAMDSRTEQSALTRMVQAGVVMSCWSSMMGELQGDYTKAPGKELLQLLRLPA